MKNLKKGAFLIGGVYICTLGIILSLVSEIGLPPLNAIAYSLNIYFPSLSIGDWTTIENLTFILLQILILRRDFKLSSLAQVIIIPLFGWFLDLNTLLMNGIRIETYGVQVMLMLVGTILIALGISFICKSNGPMGPAEALVKLISDKSKINFGNLKIAFDAIMIAIAVVFSYVFLGEIVGVREGTIVMGILTGIFVKMFNNVLISKEKSSIINHG